MKCVTCENLALLCVDCIEAGNLALKQDIVRRQARIDKALELLDEFHMQMYNRLLYKEIIPAIRTALTEDS